MIATSSRRTSFPSRRGPNTPAERMPQLAREVVKARAARLRAAAAERRSRWLDGLAGSTMAVLIENNGKGHSDNFAPVAHCRQLRGARPAMPASSAAMAIISRRYGHELARPPARRVFEDCGEGRRQPHRPDQPRRARHVDARRHRGSADRVGPWARGVASHPRSDRPPEVRAAGRARPPLDPRRGDRKDPRSGRQAAGSVGLSSPARHPGDRRQRLRQDDDHRQARRTG